MDFWLEKKECTGCFACANICPKKAIILKEDESGFKYPVIDNTKCINCGLCKKTCPILNKSIDNDYKQKVYACWSKDNDNRFVSTSGGLFTEFAKFIINNNGYVFGAAYNNENMVEHIEVNTQSDLEKIRQSKYLQSDINDSFLQTKELLDNNNLVCFCGSPCQIAGLKSFLKKDYSNLITLEFICRGMNSPKAFKSWLKEIEYKEGKKIKKVWFKYKEFGWKKSPKCTRVDFDDNTYKVYSDKNNIYMCGYLNSNLYIRPSCGDCKFNGENRQADITLADFWGIDKELDDDKGTSMILINSTKGDDLFNNIKSNIYFKEKRISDIYDGNGCFTKSVKINKNSQKFLQTINDKNFTKMVKRYGRKSLFKRFGGKIKRMILNRK